MLSPAQLPLTPTTVAAQKKRPTPMFTLGSMSIPSLCFLHLLKMKIQLLLSPGIVYLCPKFWGLISSGTGRSKVGVLIHEASHFQGVIDHTYEPAPCKALAKDDPAKAVNNADSYMFFVESLP